MRAKLTITLLFLFYHSYCIGQVSQTSSIQRITVYNLTCEGQTNPMGVDRHLPHFSWQLKSNSHDVVQRAYRIVIADDLALLQKGTGNVWDSKKTNSSQSIQIDYNGTKLQSAKSYYWKVMVWDNKGNVSKWSKPGLWQMGLLSATDWHGASWVGYENLPDSLYTVPFMGGMDNYKWQGRKDILPILRKEFKVLKPIKRALIYISGLGQFDASLNGVKIGDNFLDPGWTKYDKQALYVTFDITPHIKQGKNCIGVMLGNGMYFIPGERYRAMQGAFGYPKMICRTVIQYQDGTSQDIISDNTWKVRSGPVTFSSIFGGEDYDANLFESGWDKYGFNDKNWKQAIVVSGPLQLNSQTEPPLKIFEHFKPISITQPKPGIWVYDLGQNSSGIPFIQIKGSKGAGIKISPAELLAKDGTITTKPIGTPVYFSYKLKGDGVETWQPRFMYYGFRYLQIEGAVPQGKANSSGLPIINSVEGLHTRSSVTRVGEFSCSNNLFNKIFHLVDWAIQSNTASVFTDCPHREKTGWLEEAHLLNSSIAYNYDINNLCRKVITDMQMSQTTKGLIPDIAPEYVMYEDGFRDSPEWGSSSIIIPWYVYKWYGDKRVLTENYEMMTRYISYLQSKSNQHLLTFGLGDWYDIGPKPPGVSQLTPNGITGTAVYYYDLNIMSRIAKLLNKKDDDLMYLKLAEKVKSSFNKHYFNKDIKEYGTGSQTANAMAIYMGLVEAQDKDAVINNIIKDIRIKNNSLTAGDIGYRYLLQVLEDAGRSDVINDMNNRDDVPGYGYQLVKGATALTESWQGADNASNNHFMLGHIMEWFYSGLGGIRAAPSSVAFNKIDIRPEPVDNVIAASANFVCPYGLISSEWKKNKGGFYLKVKIPVNTSATIYLPATSSSVILESGHQIKNKSDDKSRAIVKVGSGVYSFKVTDPEQ